ncbi:MAG: mycothiol transferase [Acidimicrobiales bacterium]
MSTAAAAFTAMFDRMPDLVREAVGDLSADELARRVDPEANTVAWLIWHLTRVEDDHIAAAAAALGRSAMADQAYVADGFVGRFALPFPPEAHGYGMTTEQVGQVRADGSLLVEYYDAVHARTQAFLAAVADPDWDRVVDERWEPPVTLLARITSVANEVAQHVGQAALVRGMVERGRG